MSDDEKSLPMHELPQWSDQPPELEKQIVPPDPGRGSKDLPHEEKEKILDKIQTPQAPETPADSDLGEEWRNRINTTWNRPRGIS